MNIFCHDFIVFCSVYVVHLCVPACRNCKYIVKFSLHIYSVLAQLQFGQCSEMLFVPFKNRYSKYKVCKKNHKNIVIRWIRTNRDMNKNCVKNQKWVTAGQGGWLLRGESTININTGLYWAAKTWGTDKMGCPLTMYLWS